ncbi:lipocalin family protein [Stenotrophomonas terrae]|uniref:lipocalin family protein n=1 Tax=Stenotrophomonas terrae TaxID=405446 RepID=UPI003208E678
MINKTIALAALLIAASSAHGAEVKSVDNIDLQRYAGTWYEQANFPMYFQRNCARNTTANYRLLPEGRIEVINRCEKTDGDTLQAEGIAKPSGNGPAELKVRFAPSFLSFLPFVWADYWVIALDPGYRWAVVGTPNKEYLWILSRDKKISEGLLKELSKKAELQGFDVSKLRVTEQS